MTPDILKRAIEPFFSSKPLGKGTGLGLSMVHGLAVQLGGTLQLSSAVGKGTPCDAGAAGRDMPPLKPKVPAPAAAKGQALGRDPVCR